MSGGWSYHQPVTIRSCPGAWAGEAAEFTADRPVLLVTTSGWTTRGAVAGFEKQARGPVTVVTIDRPNPDWTDIEAAWRGLETGPGAVVVALGGGSVLDVAKALAVLVGTGDRDGLHRHLTQRAALSGDGVLPLCAVPTTAGTGSEVTGTATIWDRAQRRKLTLSHASVFPQLALLDPDLTRTLPEPVTVNSGLDALSHALESAWNRKANPVSLALAARAAGEILAVLGPLSRNLDDIVLRTRMQDAAVLAGLAIGATQSALAHSISYPLTMEHDVPHGIACSFTLPWVLEFVVEADRSGMDAFARRTGFADAAGLGGAVRELFVELGIGARLSAFVPSRQALLDLSSRMINPERAGNMVRSADPDDAKRIVAASWDALVGN